MTTYTGPFGFRFQNKHTGLLTNSDAGKRADLGWVEFPEGEPATEAVAPFTAICDGMPLSVTRYFPSMYSGEKVIEAAFRIESAAQLELPEAVEVMR